MDVYGQRAGNRDRGGLTAAEIRATKGVRRLAMLTAYDYPTALALDGTDLDMILVGDSLGEVELGYPSTRDVTLEMMCHHVRAVRHGASHTHLVGDMPADTYRTPDEAVASAKALVDAGADTVKLEGALIPQVKAIMKAGIDVMGHCGLLPQTATERRRLGKTPAEASQILEDAAALDAANCYSIVIEAVDPEVATKATSSCAAPTIGIAAGSATDGQVLVSTDLLGQLPDPPPFVKPKADVRGIVIEASTAWIREVRGQ